jgi:RNA polymerase sigma factor (sigma-70 family)
MATEARRMDMEGWLNTARPRLHRLAQLRGIPADTIDDVVQETLLEAWQCQDRLHTPDGVHRWLDEICRNVCRRYTRQRLLHQQRVLVPLAPYQHDEGEPEHAIDASATLLNSIPDTGAVDPLEALSRQELAQLLDRALGTLSADAREALELCYLLEAPQREVAAQLGLSRSALEARLHRARQQVRRMLNGALREDAEALGLVLDQESAGGWRDTRLWCTLCGRRRLMGLFLPQPDGSMNLHMRCPDCEREYGLSGVHNSNVHSRGLVQLQGLHAFRPAWKRTMQGMIERLTQALQADARPCPYCGARASLQVIDKGQVAETREGATLPAGLSRHPARFWVWWQCPRGHRDSSAGVGVFAASDLVFWSHARAQDFMRERPRWVSEPERLVEFAGQPAIRFQMTDVTGGARLTVLAHRQTLDVLAIF